MPRPITERQRKAYQGYKPQDPTKGGDPTSGGYKNISVWLLNKEAKLIGDFLGYKSMSSCLSAARWIRVELYEWITSYELREKTPGRGFEEFWEDWRIFRVWCPLQVRLAVEQILWELGGRYRKAITGFGPME